MGKGGRGEGKWMGRKEERSGGEAGGKDGKRGKIESNGYMEGRSKVKGEERGLGGETKEKESRERHRVKEEILRRTVNKRSGSEGRKKERMGGEAGGKISRGGRRD